MEDPTYVEKLSKLKCALHDLEEKILSLAETFGWDYSKLLERDYSDMVTCSINSQHKVPKKRIEHHKEICCLHSQGYNKSDKIFPEYSGSGSCISLTPELINSVTKNISPGIEKNTPRPVPQTSANFDLNFNREEKLAIYDYVIANTKKQKTFSNLCGEVAEKKEEKREMTVWEIAAAERDAKRRRASYRNKVHTSCKTHTQILREVIEAQMEMFKEEDKNEKSESKRTDSESHCLEYKRKFNNKYREEDIKKKHNSTHYYRKSYSEKRSRDSKGDTRSRSRSRDKYRKWKTGEGRSNFHKSSG